MQLPSTDMVNNRRIEKFKQRISDTLTDEDLSLFKDLVMQYQQENNVDTLDIAAALAKQVQGRAPFLLSGKSEAAPARAFERDDSPAPRKPRREKTRRETPEISAEDGRKPRREAFDAREQPLEAGMDRFRIEVGHNHKVKPGNIVGAIANEADIDSKHIGRINIFDDYSLVDLPENMPKELLNALKPVRVAGQRLNISLLDGKKARKTSAKPARARPKVRHQHKKDKGQPKRARKQN
jgi:ATP-dependent RNA helicase DeaD